MYTYIYVDVQINIYIHMFICTSTYIYVYINIYIYTYIYIYSLHTHIYIYTTHLRAHTRTYTRTHRHLEQQHLCCSVLANSNPTLIEVLKLQKVSTAFSRRILISSLICNKGVPVYAFNTNLFNPNPTI